jgi:hypothetical protein
LLVAREIEDDAIAVAHPDSVLASEVPFEGMQFESRVVGVALQKLQNVFVTLDKVGMPAQKTPLRSLVRAREDKCVHRGQRPRRLKCSCALSVTTRPSR